MPKGGKKYKGLSAGGGSKTVVKGKQSFPSRYNGGLAKEDKIVMKEKGGNFPSRYK